MQNAGTRMLMGGIVKEQEEIIWLLKINFVLGERVLVLQKRLKQLVLAHVDWII